MQGCKIANNILLNCMNVTMECSSLHPPYFICRARIAQSVQRLGSGLDDLGIRIQFLAEEKILFLSTASRLALGPVQPPIKQVPGAPFPGIKQAGREAHYSPPSSAEINIIPGAILLPLIYLHGTVLN
jgi:hypothetical protein